MTSNIHGNPIALDAVLADIKEHGGADAYLALGDLGAIGHDPVGVLERLVALGNVSFAQGTPIATSRRDSGPTPQLSMRTRTPV